jgi:hypothetical protein
MLAADPAHFFRHHKRFKLVQKITSSDFEGFSMLQKVLLQSARAGKPFKKASAAPKRHPPGKISKRRHPPGKPWPWGSMFTAFLKDAMHVLLTEAGHTVRKGMFLKKSACGCLFGGIHSIKRVSAGHPPDNILCSSAYACLPWT